jgi:hypothetical protein
MAGKSLQEHFVEPRRKSGSDASAITEILEKLILELEAIENAIKLSK